MGARKDLSMPIILLVVAAWLFILSIVSWLLSLIAGRSVRD